MKRLEQVIAWLNRNVWDHDHHVIPWAVLALILVAITMRLEASVGHLCMLLGGILAITWGGYHYQQGVKLKQDHGSVITTPAAMVPDSTPEPTVQP